MFTYAANIYKENSCPLILFTHTHIHTHKYLKASVIYAIRTITLWDNYLIENKLNDNWEWKRGTRKQWKNERKDMPV